MNGRVTVQQVVTAIQETFESDPTWKQVQASRSMTEGIPETPLVQVYFDSKETDSSGNTDRRSFSNRANPPIRVTKMLVNVDVYSRTRSNIGDDMFAVYEHVSAVDAILENQISAPFFGLQGIKAFHYRAERVVFTYASTSYVGVRFSLTITLF